MIPDFCVCRAWLFFTGFVLLAALLGGCAAKPLPSPDIDPEQAAYHWQRFQNDYVEQCPEQDFSLRASVNLSAQDQHSRFVLAMWGRTDFPIRLDIRAGIGAMLAHWREDEHGWIGYSPAGQEAFIADTVQDGARQMGLFMPLRLNALAQLLLGCWQAIVPPDYDHAQLVDNNLKYDYSLNNMRLSLILSLDGHPLFVRREGPQGWMVSIDQWADEEEEPRPTPKRISLRQEEQSAVIRIQRLDLDVAPWQDRDLSLDLPPGTRIHDISR